MTPETTSGFVIGTAGHIDHGKTSLVKALTGVDLDTLPEERARGITVALGFTHLMLPDGRQIAFIDVPGHERLVRTMIAGATGLDAALLCVSAVDGAMPQTREHVGILDLLGVRAAVVALTMADLVDAELLELAADDVRTLLIGTTLEAAPIIPFSAVTGLGHDALLEALAALPDGGRVPTPDLIGREPFRLPIDRTFVRTGFGVVATGTAASGSLTDGDTVLLLPDRLSARVRGIEVHGKKRSQALAGQRVALNLAGVDNDAVKRGMVVTRGEIEESSVIDVQYRHLPEADVLEDGAAVRVLHGTSERGGRIQRIDSREAFEPGESGWLQVRLDAGIACLPGDRCILRRPSPARTLGGGVIVDPFSVRLRERDRETHWAGLVRLAAGDATVWLERARDAGLNRAQLVRVGLLPEQGVTLGDRVVASTVAADLTAALIAELEAFHKEHALARGAGRQRVRRGRLGALGNGAFDALLERAVADGLVVLEGPLCRLATFAVALDPDQLALRDRVVAALTTAGLDGCSDKDLAALGPHAIAITHLLEADGLVSSVAGIGFLLTEPLQGMETKVRTHFRSEPVLTPQAFKEITGLTRKAAIPLLEWLDRQRVTRREGDHRVAGPAISADERQ